MSLKILTYDIKSGSEVAVEWRNGTYKSQQHLPENKLRANHVQSNKVNS